MKPATAASSANIRMKLASAKAAITAVGKLLESDEWIESPIQFSVMPDESDPHECYPLDVTATRTGIELCTSGDSSDQWKITWRELRTICQASGLIERLQEELDDLKSQVAIEQFGDDPVVKFGSSKKS